LPRAVLALVVDGGGGVKKLLTAELELRKVLHEDLDLKSPENLKKLGAWLGNMNVGYDITNISRIISVWMTASSTKSDVL
jgi:hypothetical protein